MSIIYYNQLASVPLVLGGGGYVLRHAGHPQTHPGVGRGPHLYTGK